MRLQTSASLRLLRQRPGDVLQHQRVGPVAGIGQRAARSAASRCASVPYRFKNSGIESPD
jgi:hypothetical protein